MIKYLIPAALFATLFTQAQDTTHTVDKKLINWQNADPKDDTMQGISTEKAYQLVLKDKKPTRVVVAVIDSGVDPEHEDLKNNLWVNEDEIPGNNTDDDNNGYIDDVHGWNFLGNNKGENILHETLEMTRIYTAGAKKFENVAASTWKGKDRAEYLLYVKAKAEYLKKLNEAKTEAHALASFYTRYYQSDSLVRKYLGKEQYTQEDLASITILDETIQTAVKMITFLNENGFSKSEIVRAKEHIDSKLNYHLNPDYNPRTVIGDTPDQMTGTYGNNNVMGPDASHGTHVAGIIAASRFNGIGINGIASEVKIMSVRAVPDGDERDKDIAIAIRYAIDNGANIINMSFGKSYSPQKHLVDDAIRYAESKNVLLIHAAGNDGLNTDINDNFPTKFIQPNNSVKNWLSIGACSMHNSKNFPAYFSNYGRKTVDIFAPGVDIYSTKPGNNYETNSGTSMASPMVAGVAAVLKSYYPNLTAVQIKDIILQSGLDMGRMKVFRPETKGGKKKIVRFKKLSATGKEVNVLRAVQLAEAITNQSSK